MNPLLHTSSFPHAAKGLGSMTLSGTIGKAAILLLLVVFGATLSWPLAQTPSGSILIIGGAITGFILAMVTIFKKTWSPITAPLYSLCQGVFLGGISAIYNAQLDGIVIQALMLTFGATAAVLGLYQSRIIRVTQTFYTVIFGATGAICLLYLASMVMGFFGHSIPFLHDSSPLSIGISIFICIIASLNLAIDFHTIETGIERHIPRFMEWYCAFGLMVTLIWMYLEMLRLLAKLRR